jgi:hypothetical protein
VALARARLPQALGSARTLHARAPRGGGLLPLDRLPPVIHVLGRLILCGRGLRLAVRSAAGEGRGGKFENFMAGVAGAANGCWRVPGRQMVGGGCACAGWLMTVGI